MKTPEQFLIVDLEATCDDQGSIPRDQTEIIEIGAVLVDAESLAATSEFVTFVRPVIHPTLTRFCTELTSIRQEDVANAPRFVDAIELLMRWLDGRTPQFCCWGDYDWAQLRREAKRNGFKLSLGKEHVNLKRRFSKTLGEERLYGMAEALEKVGLPLEGTYHRGIDDARNMVRLLPWVLGRRTLSQAAARS